MPDSKPPLRLAIVGAGPVGLGLALQASKALPAAHISLFDSRAVAHDVSGDPRTLALSLGSVQLLQRLGAWQADAAQAILEVHVSQQAPSLGGVLADVMGEPEVRISAAEEHVPMLGAVLSYGAIVAPLQAAWLAACEREPARLSARFGTPVQALKPLANGVEIDAGIVDSFDLAVVAEGGVFTGEVASSVARSVRSPLRRDYAQHAWVGTVRLASARAGVAYERFTRHGPAALLPLRDTRAALVWCVGRDDDPVGELDDTQRLAVLNTLFHPEVGPLTAVSPLKRFELGLIAERTLTQGRTVRIGNAAQTLHPVAGQGLNLGLRDAFELVNALSRSADVDGVLRKLEWQRAPDRWAMIAATDFLARSFTWKLPGAGAARGLGMLALQSLRPIKSALARQMMYGSR
jgi:2-octaprenyl-6-methoxyphenol hydroxylase